MDRLAASVSSISSAALVNVKISLRFLRIEFLCILQSRSCLRSLLNLGAPSERHLYASVASSTLVLITDVAYSQFFRILGRFRGASLSFYIYHRPLSALYVSTEQKFALRLFGAQTNRSNRPRSRQERLFPVACT